VALTRARDRLYVCGYEGRDRREADCWYDIVSRAMQRLDAREVPDGAGETIRRFGEAPAPMRVRAMPVETSVTLPDWTARQAAAEALPAHVEPSSAAPRAIAPAVRGDGQGLERGKAIHRALEQLAAAPPERWGAVALAAAQSVLDDGVHAQAAAQEALRVRRDLLLAHVFAPGTYGEVPLQGTIRWRGKTVELAARLDRVMPGAGDVTIVEFKSDRVVPKTAAAIPAHYVTQLALYRAAVAPLFGGRRVNCAILWTVEPRLDTVASRLLDEAGGGA
jgi:ATP-dependent helicase/nuclease subunit A